MGPRCGIEDAGGRFVGGLVVGGREVEGAGVGVLWFSDPEVDDGAFLFFWSGSFFVFVGGVTLVFVFGCRLEAGDGLGPNGV